MLELKKVFSGSRIAGTILFLFPLLSHAVGLGKLTVNSQLGEPLDMAVSLQSVTPAELGTLSVGLASRSDFARAGVEYPPNASLVKFKVQEAGGGEYFVTITSDIPVNDTFLHFLLSVSWSGGKVVREYTALLDPPLYSGAQGSAVEVPAVSSDAGDAAAASTPSVEAVVEADPSVEPEPVAVNATISSAPASSTGAVNRVVVQKGDTLSGIVARLDPPANVDLYQGLAAIVAANPDAFVYGNMNRLLAGAELEIPSFEDMAAVSQPAARDTYVAQLDEFNAYRTIVASGAAPEPEVAEITPPAPEPVIEPVAEPEPLVEAEPEVAADAEVAVETEPEVVEEPVAVEPAVEPEQEEVTVSEPAVSEPTEADEASRLSISQDADPEELEIAASGEVGEAAQVDALQTQIAQLDEAMLASGEVNTDLREQLDEMQAQMDRLTRLLEVEDTSLALAQNEAMNDADVTGETDEADVLLAGQADSAVAGDSSDGGDEGGSPESAPDGDSGGVVEADDVTAEDESATLAVDTAAEATAETAVTAAVETEDTMADSAAAVSAAVETATDSSDSVEPVEETATETAEAEAVAAADTGSQESGTSRAVVETSIMDAVTGVFSSLGGMLGSFSNYALKIAAGLIAVLAGLFFFRRYRSRREFEESMLDIESEQVSVSSEAASLQQMSAASGIDLASQNSDLELTVGGGMSFLSEDGVTGVAEEDNEVIQAGVVDPLAEADVYLAYDRDEQAVQVLKEAYESNPERIELAEKLLEIYHKQDDRRAFDALAENVHVRYPAGTPEWDRIAGMGREVSPENKLFQTELTAGLDAGAESEITLAGEGSGTFSASRDEFDIDLGEDELEMVDKADETDGALAELDLGDATDDQAPAIEEFKLDTPDEDDDVAEDIQDIDTPTLSQIIQGPIEEPPAVKMSTEAADEPAEAEVAESQKAESPEPVAENLEETAESLDEDSFLSEMSEQSLGQLEPYHESETALELAKAYIELGEKDIAKGFIEEVISEGSDKQRQKAEKMVKDLAE